MNNANDFSDIAYQEEQRRLAEERARRKVREEVEDTKWLMSSKRGRRIVYAILERAGVWRLSFNTNALQMAFNEGSRNEGLALLARLTEHCPELYATMLKEHRDDD